MHILVVDDEELALAELTHELKIVFPNAALHGYRNPKEAIEYAAALSAEGEVFSYAFLDIKMRGMSGLELARQLKIRPRSFMRRSSDTSSDSWKRTVYRE